MTASKSKDKSPLKDHPLRQAGQSLREERERLLEDTFTPWALAAAFSVALAVMEWMHTLLSIPHSPWTLTCLAIVVLSLAVWRLSRLRARMRNLRLGISGEVAVGQYLDRLHFNGYQVFHDVQGENFNLDHVLIGPAGVFTVETKTWNKPYSDARISFDGEKLLCAGKVPDSDPVVQAKAQARWLRTQLRESTGKDFDVWPVIVFPGWFIEARAAAHNKLWVLEPKALPSFLSNEPEALPIADRQLASYHLSRMIRNTDKLR